MQGVFGILFFGVCGGYEGEQCVIEFGFGCGSCSGVCGCDCDICFCCMVGEFLGVGEGWYFWWYVVEDIGVCVFFCGFCGVLVYQYFFWCFCDFVGEYVWVLMYYFFGQGVGDVVDVEWVVGVLCCDCCVEQYLLEQVFQFFVEVVVCVGFDCVDYFV